MFSWCVDFPYQVVVISESDVMYSAHMHASPPSNFPASSSAEKVIYSCYLSPMGQLYLLWDNSSLRQMELKKEKKKNTENSTNIIT